MISALLTVPFVLVVLLTSGRPALGLGSGFLESLAEALFTYAFCFAVVFVLAISFLLQAFGAVSLLMIALRRMVPWTVRSLRTEANAPLPVRKTVLWVFNIPYFMDPADLKVRRTEATYSRRVFLRAVGVLLLLDFAFGVYLCLNPMFLTMLPFQELFAIVTVLSLGVPLILIWIESYAAAGVYIPGEKRDLELARGLRNRAMGVLVPIGTIMVILRLAVQTVQWDSLIGLLEVLGIYLFFNVALGAAMIYVYFHFFERQAAQFEI
jgi:hypothetical protein